MAIDVYRQEGKKRLWLGSFSAKGDLLSSFRARTGIGIDEYGTTRLSAQQLKLLANVAHEVSCAFDVSLPVQEGGVFLLEGD